jgi:hypothetical protein
LVANGGSISGIMDNKIGSYNLGNVKLNNDLTFNGIDFRLSDLKSDRLSGNYSGSGKVIIDNINIIGSKTTRDFIRVKLSDVIGIDDKHLNVKAQKLNDIMTPIKNVQHLKEKEQYLSDLEDSINSILDILDSQVKEADKEYRNAETECRKVDDKFIQHMKTLYNHCNTAAEIPHYEEHLFREDNYEMNQAEYRRLCNVLDQSCTDVEQMGSIYDEKTDSAFTVQKTWSTLCDVKAAWQRVNNIKSQFSRIQKKFK